MLTAMTEEDWTIVLQVFDASRSRRGDKGRDDRRTFLAWVRTAIDGDLDSVFATLGRLPSKLSCGNLASIGSNPSRACVGPGEYGRKVLEFLNPTKEHGFIQPQSGGKDAFDSEPACLS